mmetsp:Transcript_8413/g.26033  ORF Transcript_8413/g.26033 Transcript_8413/m.26033 type:complete len:246 (-) Transcript_8413:1398-2135(-)
MCGLGQPEGGRRLRGLAKGGRVTLAEETLSGELFHGGQLCVSSEEAAAEAKAMVLFAGAKLGHARHEVRVGGGGGGHGGVLRLTPADVFEEAACALIAVVHAFGEHLGQDVGHRGRDVLAEGVGALRGLDQVRLEQAAVVVLGAVERQSVGKHEEEKYAQRVDVRALIHGVGHTSCALRRRAQVGGARQRGQLRVGGWIGRRRLVQLRGSRSRRVTTAVRPDAAVAVSICRGEAERGGARACVRA